MLSGMAIVFASTLAFPSQPLHLRATAMRQPSLHSFQRVATAPLLVGAAPEESSKKNIVAPDSPARNPRPAPRQWFILIALLLIYVNNQWSRMLPSFLVSFDPAVIAQRSPRELMNVGLGFDAQQYGLLVSYAFTLVYVVCSLFAGIVSDRFPRTLIILAAAGGWSLATAASATAQTYSQLLGARVLLGISQAFSGPAAHTLVSSTFPASMRATANAIYTSGIYFGGALASLSVVLARMLGWRATMLTVALAVLPPAALLLIAQRGASTSTSPSTSSPPAAPPSATAASPSAASPAAARSTEPRGLRAVLRVNSVRWLLAGTCARLFAGFAIGAWAAPYFRSAFPTRSGQYALYNALIVAGGGTLSVVGGGIAADRLTSDGKKPQRAALLPMIGSLAAIPFWLGAVRLDSFGLAMSSLLAAYLLAECWYGVTIAMLQGALPPAVWGTALGSLNVVQVVSNLAPLLLGALYRRGAPLRLLLSVSVPLAYATTALCFWRAMAARKAEASAKGA